MSIHVALNHVTHYRYDRPVALGPQVVRLRPAPHARTPVLAYSQRVTPAKHFVNWQQDPQSNWLARLVFPEPVRELKIEVDLVAKLSVINPFDFFLEPRAEKFPFRYDEAQLHELAPYLVRGALTPRFKRYLDAVPRTPTPTVDFLVALNMRLAKDIAILDPKAGPLIAIREHVVTRKSLGGIVTDLSSRALDAKGEPIRCRRPASIALSALSGASRRSRLARMRSCTKVSLAITVGLSTNG